MKLPRKVTAFAVLSSVLSVMLGFVAWYFSPAKVEDMDQMLYCACGYSKVQFKAGEITMVEYYHDTLKSGDIIGRYQLKSHGVEMEIYFQGKTNRTRFETDHIGILSPPDGGFRRYQALPGESMKVSIRRLLRKSS